MSRILLQYLRKKVRMGTSALVSALNALSREADEADSDNSDGEAPRSDREDRMSGSILPKNNRPKGE